MTTCGTVTKSLLLLAVVVAMTGRGSAGENGDDKGLQGSSGDATQTHHATSCDVCGVSTKKNKTNFLFLCAVEKFSECCTKVTRQQITETIVDYVVQRKSGHCVNAVM